MNDNVTYPDVAGYRLEDAINVLKEHGFEISGIRITAPPRQAGETYDDNFRVLQVFVAGKKKVNLLICDPMINC